MRSAKIKMNVNQERINVCTTCRQRTYQSYSMFWFFFCSSFSNVEKETKNKKQGVDGDRYYRVEKKKKEND